MHEEMTDITLYCLEKKEGLRTAFTITVEKNKLFGKKLKILMNIRIWKVQFTFSDKEKLVRLLHKGLSIEGEAQKTEIRNATDEIGQHFSEPPAEHIHTSILCFKFC
ncbi:unnamed protein product [Rhizophagus irregularis]|nr:unnamed protein product [Rhizophagus irregularis]